MNLGDLNLEFKGNMKPSSSLKILYPAAFHFKEERVLAAHPPSFHPQRVFGYLENERKLEKRKRGGSTKSFPPKRNFINEEDPLTMLGLGAFIAKPSLQITKIT